MSKNNIVIKRATADYFKFLPDIETAAATVFKDYIPACADLPPSPESDYHSLLETSAVFIACTNTDTVVGFIVVTTLDNHGHIAEVDVSPEYAQKGIGRNLIKQALLWAKDKNYEWVTLTTFKNIPFNAPFYKKLGFTEFTPSKDQPEILKTVEHERHILGKISENNPRVTMRLNIHS